MTREGGGNPWSDTATISFYFFVFFSFFSLKIFPLPPAAPRQILSEGPCVLGAMACVCVAPSQPLGLGKCRGYRWRGKVVLKLATLLSLSFSEFVCIKHMYILLVYGVLSLYLSVHEYLFLRLSDINKIHRHTDRVIILSTVVN